MCADYDIREKAGRTQCVLTDIREKDDRTQCVLTVPSWRRLVGPSVC